jgi:ribonuclease R
MTPNTPEDLFRAEKERSQSERGSTHAQLLAEAKAAFDKLMAEGQAARKSGRPRKNPPPPLKAVIVEPPKAKQPAPKAPARKAAAKTPAKKAAKPVKKPAVKPVAKKSAARKPAKAGAAKKPAAKKAAKPGKRR